MSMKRCLSYTARSLRVWIIYSNQRHCKCCLFKWCFGVLMKYSKRHENAQRRALIGRWMLGLVHQTSTPRLTSCCTHRDLLKLLNTPRSLNAFRCWCTPSQIFSASSSPYYHTLNHNKRQFLISPTATLWIAFCFPNFSEAITFIFGRYQISDSVIQ